MIPQDLPINSNPHIKHSGSETALGPLNTIPKEILQLIVVNAPGKDLSSLSQTNNVLNKVTTQLVNTNLINQLDEFIIKLQNELEIIKSKPMPPIIQKQIDEALLQLKGMEKKQVFKGVNLSEISSSFKSTKDEIILVLSKINLSKLQILLINKDNYPEFFKDILSLAIIKHLFDNKMAVEGIKKGIEFKHYEFVLEHVLNIKSKSDKYRLLTILSAETLKNYDMDLALKTLENIKDKDLKKASINKLQQPWGN